MSMMNLPVSRVSPVARYPVSARGQRLSRRHGVPARWFGPIREVALVVLAVIAYFLVRGLVDADPGTALSHARSLVNLERSLGLFHEPTWQAWVIQHPAFVDLLNAIYVYGHWPLIALTLGWLFLRQRDAFREIRLVMVLSGLVGFACFFLFPMAPPRFLPDLGFVDTVVLHSDAYRVLQPPSMTNQYAAMPSLHVGWNLLMGVAMVRHASSRLVRGFGYVMPLVMWAATVLTGNHFLVDGVVGGTIVLTVLAVVRWWHRRNDLPNASMPGSI